MLGSLRSNRHLWGSVLLVCITVSAAAICSRTGKSSVDDSHANSDFDFPIPGVTDSIGADTGTAPEFELRSGYANRRSHRGDQLVPISGEMANQLAAFDVSETECGSYVRVVDDAGVSHVGTLLRRDANYVELMNCLTREVVPGPRGIQQLKTSHVPLQSFSRASIAGFTAIFPPAPGYAAGDFPGDWSPATIGEIVYRDGSRQRWGQPPAAPGTGGDSAPDEGEVRPASAVKSRQGGG